MAWNTDGRKSWGKAEDDQLRLLLEAETSPGTIAKVMDRTKSFICRRIEIIAALAKYQKRNCMCCGHDFTSAGPHNRLCGNCRTRNVSPYAP